MIVSFDTLPSTSRVWIYQSDRKLKTEEQDFIEQSATYFVKAWTAHKKDLRAGFRIFHDRFLVLSVDEDYQPASGCSVDSSVHFIRKLENNLDISLLDRSQIALIVHRDIYVFNIQELKRQIKHGSVSPKAIVFNNSITHKHELASSWTVPLEQSWLRKYLVETA